MDTKGRLLVVIVCSFMLKVVKAWDNKRLSRKCVIIQGVPKKIPFDNFLRKITYDISGSV